MESLEGMIRNSVKTVKCVGLVLEKVRNLENINLLSPLFRMIEQSDTLSTLSV